MKYEKTHDTSTKHTIITFRTIIRASHVQLRKRTKHTDTELSRIRGTVTPPEIGTATCFLFAAEALTRNTNN